MSDDLIKRLRSQEAVDARPHQIEQLTDEAADLIEQQAARIAELEAQIATVAPAVDAQPVAWINSRDLQNLRDGKSRWAKAFTGVDGKPFEASPVFESAQSEGLRKDAERYRLIRDVLRLDDVRWMNIANWNQANISAEVWDSEIDAALPQHKAGEKE